MEHRCSFTADCDTLDMADFLDGSRCSQSTPLITRAFTSKGDRTCEPGEASEKTGVPLHLRSRHREKAAPCFRPEWVSSALKKTKEKKTRLRRQLADEMTTVSFLADTCSHVRGAWSSRFPFIVEGIQAKGGATLGMEGMEGHTGIAQQITPADAGSRRPASAGWTQAWWGRQFPPPGFPGAKVGA